MTTKIIIIYWIIAVVASALYGWKAVEIFVSSTEADNKPRSWWIHQFWLNFLGALVGWLALWFVGRKFTGCVFGVCTATVEALDIVGVLVAFIGITGYLPNTVVSIVLSISGLAVTLTKVLADWVISKLR